jgi:undecaprenyl-diphosphatase
MFSNFNWLRQNSFLSDEIIRVVKKNHRKPHLDIEVFGNIAGTFTEYKIEFLIAISLVVICLTLLYFLVQFLIPDAFNFIDYNCFVFLQSYHSGTNTLLAETITFCGTGSFLIPVYLLIVILFLKKGQYNYAYMIALAAISSVILGWILKDIFQRSRPNAHLVMGAGGYSFPSGHSLGGFIFCGILIFMVGRTNISYLIKWILYFLTIVFGFSVGISRIYLHVHYATDVLGSLFIAVAWLSLLHIIFRVIFRDDMHSEPKKVSGDELNPNYYLDN